MTKRKTFPTLGMFFYPLIYPMKKLLAASLVLALTLSTGTTYATKPLAATPAINAVQAQINPAQTKKATANAVEQDILSMQQDSVNFIRQALNTYLSQDQKQTGDVDLGVSVDSAYGTGSVRLTIDKYVSVLSILQGKQEADYQGKIHLDVHPSAAVTASGTYAVTGDVTFSLNLKVIGNDIYVTLNALDFNIQTEDQSILESVSEAKNQMAKYIGKTIHIEGEGGINQAEMLRKTNLALDILASNSLFSVHSKLKNGYRLKLNQRTFLKLSKVFGRGAVAKLDFNKSILTYEKSGDTTTISAVENRTAWKTLSKLTRNNGAYSFDVIGNGKGKKKTEAFNLHIDGSTLTLSSHTSDADVNISYANGNLNLASNWKQMDYQNGKFVTVTHGFSLNGALSLDGTADLKATYDGVSVGSLKVTKDGSTYHSKFHLDIVPEENVKIVVDLLENLTIEPGTYNVTAPTTFIEMDDIH